MRAKTLNTANVAISLLRRLAVALESGLSHVFIFDDTTVTASYDDLASVAHTADNHAFRDGLQDCAARYTSNINVDQTDVLDAAGQALGDGAGFGTIAVADDGGCSSATLLEQVLAAGGDTVSNCGKGDHASVQETRLVLLDRLAVGIEALLVALLVLAAKSGADVLGVLGSLAHSLCRQTGGAAGKSIDLADALVSCRAKLHGFGGGLDLLGEAIGTRGQDVTQTAAGGYNEARSGCSVLDHTAILVSGMASHLQVVFADGLDTDAAAVRGDFELDRRCERAG